LTSKPPMTRLFDPYILDMVKKCQAYQWLTDSSL
jgi:hypothetical protein